MRRASLLLMIAVLLTGCSATSPYPDFSEEQWNRDFYKCTRDSQKISSGTGPSLYDRQEMAFYRCMVAHGYAKN
ncbi:MAG: hypothetical protein HYY65_02370 [Candidatus Tectomicrobia bacterium]|uniref:Lipoprotein n=1 Tax=Tectimicrobiota bacterium TaxID=2528274 RepID=A0A932GMK5_UNCTE|nr:hypothetical protein [Candidatus Tectomicrobia bacterium]